jgi:AGZA family xanthine/uracil permease-like MFS transporter
VKFFQLSEHHTDVPTEVLAGVTTFLTMAYIVVVNPSILAATGMDQGALLTVTCLAAGLATLMMALFTNYPFALAPGMGLNAFFAYTVVLQMKVPWETALGIIFVEGLVFVGLTMGNVRQLLVEAIPATLKHAVGAGIGLFITLIGLKNAGIVVASPATLVQLGDVSKAGPLLALGGLVVTAALAARKIPGNLLLGMLLVSLAAWVSGHSPWPKGLIATPPSPAPLVGALDLKEVWAMPKLEFFSILLAFFFVDFFDTLGTLIGVSARAGFLDQEGNLPKAKGAFMADALGTTFGAVLGTSTVTTFIESASGVHAGGRTGLTGVVTAGLFFLAPFLAPVLLAIPPEATAPALILVGLSMMEGIKQIDFADVEQGLAAFVCIVLMPFTFSISEGIVFGILTYTLVRILAGNAQQVPRALFFLSGLFLLRIFSGMH